MAVPVFIVLAFAPGLFWLWFFARRKVYRPAPRRLLAITFFVGLLATIPAAIMEFVFIDESALREPTAAIGHVALAMFLVVGPVEEVCKFLAVRLVAFRSLYFEEPMDGLVYAAAASLGFASLENFFYMLAYGPEVIIVRAPISTLFHVVGASFWGYALGCQAQGRAGKGLVTVGLVVSALLHGLFNVAVFANPLLGLAVVGLGCWWLFSRLRWSRRVSPLRYRRNYPRIFCSLCRQLILVVSRYCSFCGTAVARPWGPLHCSNCHTLSRADASFCTGCGDKLETRIRRL